VAGPEASDGRVIGFPVGGDHPEGDVLLAAALDPPSRALADRVGVEAERHHHLRVMGGAAPAVVAIGAIEALEVELLDRVQDEPGEMIGGEPLTKVRRHQELLVTLAREEVWAHSWMLGPGPDGGLCDTLHGKQRLAIFPHSWPTARLIFF
jgi:hypothetical protein